MWNPLAVRRLIARIVYIDKKRTAIVAERTSGTARPAVLKTPATIVLKNPRR
jgi:hypothetical protein